MRRFVSRYVWNIGVFASYLLVRVIQWTCRFREVGATFRDEAAALGASGGYVIAAWHEHVLSLVISQRGHPIRALVSRSGGGRAVGVVCRLYGYTVIEGSRDRDGKDRGGLRALVALRRCLTDGFPAALTVDGSVGPRHHVKPGVVELARSSACPILPFSVHYSRCWELNTWDRLKIPKPFSTVTVAFGNPITVEQGADRASLQLLVGTHLMDLESQLRRN